MGGKKSSKKQDRYTLMVLNLLKELSKTAEARLSIREMSRVLKINHMAVSRAVKRLKNILDVKYGSDFESFRLPLMLVKMRDDMKDLPTKELIKRANLSLRMENEYFKK